MQKALALAKALTFALIALPATGHEFKVGEITVGHPFAHPTANMAMAGAGYLTLTNSGDTADRLIAVEAAFPRVMLHGSVKTDGVARMIHLDNGVELLPGQTVEFAPGGLHVMFMGLDGDPFVEGETIPATLVFENAGRLEVVFNVEPMKSGMDMNHDHAGHSMGSGS